MEEREAILEKLQRPLSLLTSSFLSYLLEVSNPLSDTRDKALGDALRKIAADEKADTEALIELIYELGGVAGDISFGMGDAHYNYLSAGYLLDRILKQLREHRAEFERLAQEVKSEPRAADLLARIATGHRQAVESIESAVAATRKAAEAAAAPAPAAPAKPAAPAAKPAAKTIDPEKLAELKAAAEKKRASLAATAAPKEAVSEKPPAS